MPHQDRPESPTEESNGFSRAEDVNHAGEFFGTGADLTQLSGAASDAADLRQLAGRLHEAILQFHQAPVPVIGGINGVAAGAGFGLALGTASRLVTESFDRSLEAQLAAETDAIGQAAGTTDYERGFAAFFGDGDPEFVGE